MNYQEFLERKRQLGTNDGFSPEWMPDFLFLFQAAMVGGLSAKAGRRFSPTAAWVRRQCNKYSHWIWRQYASCFWDDIRVWRTLPFRGGKDEDDEKHVHPLQLDVIERICVLWSNPGEIVLTPFMGVGSEVCGAIANGRKGIGIELKPSYYRQAVRNIEHVLQHGLGESETREIAMDDPQGELTA